MHRRDLLSYLGCTAIALTLMGKDARSCSTCGGLLHTCHQHEQNTIINQVSLFTRPRLSTLTLTQILGSSQASVLINGLAIQLQSKLLNKAVLAFSFQLK